MATTRLIPPHVGKGRTVAEALGRTTDYVKNPEKTNGGDLAKSLTKGKHAFIVCTHVDKEHIHSHIVFNSTTLDCSQKFNNFCGSSFAVRKISDQLCWENGLSVIENPKPSRAAMAHGWVKSRLPSGNN